jgi:hypothetical protein
MFNRDKYEIIVFAIGHSKSMKVFKHVEAITETVSRANCLGLMQCSYARP